MKLGYPNHPRRDLTQEIAWIGRNGFDFIDLFLEPDLGESRDVVPENIRDSMSEFGLDGVGHLAWYLPIGSPIRELREGAVAASKRYLALFAACGIKKVTIHAHWPPSMFSVEEGIEFQTKSLKALLEWCSANAMTLMYEPVGDSREDRSTLEHLFNLNPELAFHLDIGHFNLNGRNPGDFAEAFRDRLVHVHLHDNDGNRDLHLPMGAGKIDWKAFLPRLKAVYDGTITIEVFSAEREYALHTQRRLKEVWNTL
ncbi:MAG: sugar phosphate isomerase/epimerase [Candidatus Riflebacteria bacterium]|nr:sugar phosphate isomerase/epimerase [Candidatus Riflebacteria bacterium]